MFSGIAGSFFFTAVVRASGAAATAQQLEMLHSMAEHVNTGQRFFVTDHESVLLYESPDADPLKQFSNVSWICQPSINADHGSYYTDLVADALTFRVETDYISDNKDSVSGVFTPQGYVATWIGDRYEETYIDYDNSTVQRFFDFGNGRASITGYESSDSSSATGLVFSGRGEWVMDLQDPRLVEMSRVLNYTVDTGRLCHVVRSYLDWKTRLEQDATDNSSSYSQPDSANNNHNNSSVLIVGVVIAGVLLVNVFGCFVYHLRSNRKKQVADIDYESPEESSPSSKQHVSDLEDRM
jgi:hypothetical protein